MKVLLTDDSAFMRTILKAALKEIPTIEFMEAENGDVAIELYRQYRFDVVFLDIIMPVKNGMMALEEIRQINPQAKVIIVTSVSQDEMVNKAKELNANAFLPKPFQPQQIRDVFNLVIAETPVIDVVGTSVSGISPEYSGITDPTVSVEAVVVSAAMPPTAPTSNILPNTVPAVQPILVSPALEAQITQSIEPAPVSKPDLFPPAQSAQ